MRQKGSRLALYAVALALSLVLGACGGDEDVFQLESVAQAATRTLDAGSSRMDFTMQVEVQGEKFQIDGDGIFDYRTGRGRMTMELPDDLGGGDVEAIADGLVIYMRFPGIEEALPGGKEWMKMDMVALSKKLGIDAGQFDQYQQNPVDALQAMRGADAKPEVVGTEDVRDVPTTHYRAVIDLRKALTADLKKATTAERKRMKASLERLIRMSGTSKLPVEIWVDDQGIIRRESMAMSVRQQGETAEMTMTFDLYDFGVQVDVELPPAEKVVDALELLTEEDLKAITGG